MRLAKRHSKKTHRTCCRLTLEALESRAMLHAAGALLGYAYIDADGDGTRDESEFGIPGVVIRLSKGDSSDTAERSTLTDDQGS